MPDDANLWTLRDFEYHFDIWISTEHPDQDLVNEVGAWLLSRFESPYQGVRREPGFANLWFGVIPGTVRDGTVVACSYLVVESEHAVQCTSIATLSWPV